MPWNHLLDAKLLSLDLIQSDKNGDNMGIFDIDDAKLQAFYHRAWLEANWGFVDPRKYPYLDKALYVYAKEHECSYDEALIFAKTGKKMGKLTD